jgi:hypothetical protein
VKDFGVKCDSGFCKPVRSVGWIFWNWLHGQKLIEILFTTVDHARLAFDVALLCQQMQRVNRGRSVDLGLQLNILGCNGCLTFCDVLQNLELNVSQCHAISSRSAASHTLSLAPLMTSVVVNR